MTDLQIWKYFCIFLQFSIQDIITYSPCPLNYLKWCVFQTSHSSPSSYLEIFPLVEILLNSWCPGLDINLHCHTRIHFWPPDIAFLQRNISEEKNTLCNYLFPPPKPFNAFRSYKVGNDFHFFNLDICLNYHFLMSSEIKVLCYLPYSGCNSMGITCTVIHSVTVSSKMMFLKYGMNRTWKNCYQYKQWLI